MKICLKPETKFSPVKQEMGKIPIKLVFKVKWINALLVYVMVIYTVCVGSFISHSYAIVVSGLSILNDMIVLSISFNENWLK